MSDRPKSYEWTTETRLALAIWLVALIARLPAALSTPATVVYDSDELTFLNSQLGLIAGLVPSALQWPAATVWFAFLPLILVHFLVSSGPGLTAVLEADPVAFAEALAFYCGKVFYAPNTLLTPARILLAVASSLAPVLFFRLLPKQFSTGGRALGSLVIATSPTLIGQTAIVKGDGVGTLFWCISLAYLIRFLVSDTGSPATGSIIRSAVHLSLATASRLTHAAAVPVLALTAMWKSRRSGPWRTLVRTLLALVLPILVFLPFIWTQPFSLQKALVGNLVLLGGMESGSQPLLGLALQLLNLTGVAAAALAVFGWLALWSRPHGWELAVVVSLIIFSFGAPLLGAGYIAPRYTLPLLPVFAFLVVGGADRLENMMSVGRTSARTRVVLVAVTVIAVTVPNFLATARWLQNNRIAIPRVRVAEWIRDQVPEGDRIGIPVRMAPLIPPSSVALSRVLDRYELQSSSAVERAARLLGRDLAADDTGDDRLFLLEYWLSDEEAQDIFRFRAMRAASIEARATGALWDALYYQPGDTVPEKPDRVPMREARELFMSGDLRVFVTREPDQELESMGLEPAREFSSWRIYVQPTANQAVTPGGGES